MNNIKQLCPQCGVRVYPVYRARRKCGYILRLEDKVKPTRIHISRRPMPPWITKEQKKEMKRIYRERDRLNKQGGLKYEVDHIVPLNGDGVCGLHVPWNLQILTARSNRRKRNLYRKQQ